jgi:hypothetical protein
MNKLLTHPVSGLENYKELFEKLTTAKGAIKIYCEVAALEGEEMQDAQMAGARR